MDWKIQPRRQTQWQVIQHSRTALDTLSHLVDFNTKLSQSLGSKLGEIRFELADFKECFDVLKQAVQHIQIEMESEMVRIVSTLIKQKNAELLKLTNTMWTSNHELQIQLSKRTSELESANRQMFQQRVEYVNKLDIVLDGVKVARESHAKLENITKHSLLGGEEMFTQLSSMVRSYAAIITTKERDIRALNSQIRELNKSLSVLATSHQATMQEVSVLQHQERRMASELKQKSVDFSNVQAQLTSVKHKFRDKDRRFESLQSDNQSLQQQIHQLEKEKAALSMAATLAAANAARMTAAATAAATARQTAAGMPTLTPTPILATDTAPAGVDGSGGGSGGGFAFSAINVPHDTWVANDATTITSVRALMMTPRKHVKPGPRERNEGVVGRTEGQEDGVELMMSPRKSGGEAVGGQEIAGGKDVVEGKENADVGRGNTDAMEVEGEVGQREEGQIAATAAEEVGPNIQQADRGGARRGEGGTKDGAIRSIHQRSQHQQERQQQQPLQPQQLRQLQRTQQQEQLRQPQHVYLQRLETYHQQKEQHDKQLQKVAREDQLVEKGTKEGGKENISGNNMCGSERAILHSPAPRRIPPSSLFPSLAPPPSPSVVAPPSSTPSTPCKLGSPSPYGPAFRSAHSSASASASAAASSAASSSSYFSYTSCPPASPFSLANVDSSRISSSSYSSSGNRRLEQTLQKYAALNTTSLTPTPTGIPAAGASARAKLMMQLAGHD